MEDIVAVEVLLRNGRKRYFLTWGRVQDRVDGTTLEALVLTHATKFALGGPAKKARLCPTLRSASRQPYFYEGLFQMAQQRIPLGNGYAAWKKRTDRRMRRGLDLYYLGR